MTSILKVSEIQDPTNSNTALTIDSSGNVAIPGHVVQVVHNYTDTKTYASIAGTPYSALDVLVTPKLAGSFFIVDTAVTVSLNTSGTADTDMALATVYRVGGSSSTLTTAEYVSCGGQSNDGSRERAGGHIGWFSTDTWANNWSGTYGAQYNTSLMSSCLKITPSYTLGQDIHFRVLGQSDRANWMIFNSHSTGTNGGGVTSLKITEVAQ